MANWLDIFAMPVQNRPNVLLDLVFVTPDVEIRLLGEDHLLPDGTEAFSLVGHQFSAGGWWKKLGEGVSTTWVARNIKDELVQRSMGKLLYPPRNVRFYSESQLEHAITIPGKLFAHCAAMELFKLAEGRVIRFVIAASNDYPCALEYCCSDGECSNLLRGLKQYDLPVLP